MINAQFTRSYLAQHHVHVRREMCGAWSLERGKSCCGKTQKIDACRKSTDLAGGLSLPSF